MNRQCSSCGGFCRKSGCERENVEPTPDPIYTAPPQREWVGLTGEELQEIYQGAGTVHFKFAMVEAKLKEKNT